MTATQTTPSSSTKAVNAIGGGGFLAGLLQIALGFVANVNQTGTHGIDKAVVWSGVLTALGSLATLAAKHVPIAVLEAKAKHYEGIVDEALTPYKPQLDQLGDIVKADPQFQEEWGKLRDRVAAVETKDESAAGLNAQQRDEVNDYISSAIGRFATGTTPAAPAAPEGVQVPGFTAPQG